MNANLRKHSLGWIGLGRMGLPMAQRLAQAGANIGGYNRTRSKVEPLARCGGALVDSPADLADRDIVFTMVSTAGDLFDVVTGKNGLLSHPTQAPKVLVDLSTISESDSVRLREIAAERDVALLVVPVSGNDVVARAGRLSVLASGPRAVFDTVSPYLSCFGPSVTYIGKGDTARTAKICHNMLLAITYQGLAEIAVLGEQHGVPRHVLLDVINRSVLGSTYSKYKSPAIVNLDYIVTFTLDLLHKDLALALDAGRAAGTALPLTTAVQSLVERTIGNLGGALDYTTLLGQQALDSGLEIRSEDVETNDGLRQPGSAAKSEGQQ